MPFSIRRALRAAARLAAVGAVAFAPNAGAQNEDAMTKPGTAQRVLSLPPRVVPADRQVTTSPGTNIVNPSAAQKVGGVP